MPYCKCSVTNCQLQTPQSVCIYTCEHTQHTNKHTHIHTPNYTKEIHTQFTCSEFSILNIQANTLESLLMANKPNAHVSPSNGKSTIMAKTKLLQIYIMIHNKSHDIQYAKKLIQYTDSQLHCLLGYQEAGVLFSITP